MSIIILSGTYRELYNSHNIEYMYKDKKYAILWIACVIILSAIYSIQRRRPRSKRELAIWRTECELGAITDPECPVDGGWSDWGSWSSCHGPCDDVGHRCRTRKCMNPPPSQDGLPCEGPDEIIESCYITNCTAKDYRKIVEREPTKKVALQQLEVVPALMKRCLEMECPFEAIEAALTPVNTWQIHPETLWNALQCIKHNLGCPMIGEWGSWGEWSACAARCGQGMRWRIRRCDNPPPSEAGLVCVGTPLQANECEGDQCAVDLNSEVYAAWGEWRQWSSCSESCGVGVRRRRRICIEKLKPVETVMWGTHCQGQHGQLEVCENNHCLLNGSWSSWAAWGPCSQSCGAGKRSRTRSCTRPIPAGGGSPCPGPRTEVASCHLTPCEVHSHTVAVFNGESLLQYDFKFKHSTFIHFYIRFLPLSPHGTLVRSGPVRNPRVRLSLQKWHVCLDANDLGSCNVPRICSPSAIQPAVWHTVLVTVSNEAATLRLDDAQTQIRGAFTCDPELPDEKVNIIVGEKLRGEIQELILNFIPLSMTVHRDLKGQLDFVPDSALNVAYERASTEEAYLPLEADQYVRLPCYNSQDKWRIELTVKSKRETGTILFLRDYESNNWLHVELQNMRLKFKLVSGEFVYESSSSTEYSPDQWLDVTLIKNRNTNTIEATINAGERLHVILGNENSRQRLERKTTDRNELKSSISGLFSKDPIEKSITRPLCTDEFFIGGVPMEVKNQLSEDFTPFFGYIASVSINNLLQDLHKFSVERYKDGKVQVSSRTSSVSGLYYETTWGESNRLNLTCLHARTLRLYHSAQWLFLDTGIDEALKGKSVRSIDDGKVLRLVATADNDLRGFYTCRVHTNKRTVNIVTYGVVGRAQRKVSSCDTTTTVALVTTLVLVIGTLAWLVLEGIDDLRNGYGFFRDRQLSSAEETEAVCDYIDNNSHLFTCKSDIKTSKARARSRARRLISSLSFGAQEPEGLMQVRKFMPPTSEESSSPELPALPAINGYESSHDVCALRCEPCYISSPRHGSIITPRGRLTSSSSLEITSPRFLCSRLLVAKRLRSSKESFNLKSGRSAMNRNIESSPKTRLNTVTNKSSTYLNQSPAMKILQKFRQLKCDD